MDQNKQKNDYVVVATNKQGALLAQYGVRSTSIAGAIKQVRKLHGATWDLNNTILSARSARGDYLSVRCR